MSDRMTPIPFGELMNWLLTEHETGTVFGLHAPYQAAGKVLPLFGEKLETPFGPAAGPHTQLSQNIIAAYYTGGRFFELKTVQTLDGEDLPVSKPCILADDECYNVEWSTELRVEEAFAEYVKAWFALKLISRAWQLGAPDGFMFNMSVGYSFEGITSKKIDNFIEGLKDASRTPVWAECLAWARANLGRLPGVDEAYLNAISPHVCSSITLSTLHGCPPQEIERIAAYLIETKKLNTFVKCNPTLLGYDFARRTLDALGFDYIVFDDFHFKDDLQYADAVPMFTRLLALADQHGLSFGLKLTNTFPVTIAQQELPGEEMYMSGRSLYPLTIELARRISTEFDGKLRISFSGGADAFNIEALFDAGIWPITMATTLLKPGGYQRFKQIAEMLDRRDYRPFDGVSIGKLQTLAQRARSDTRSQKAIKPAPARKFPDKVPLLDCFTAGCTHGCPIAQDIPEYISLVGKGDYDAALALIMQKNPLPFITGTICPHHCADKCARNFYEESVHIRGAKLTAAKGGYAAACAALSPAESSGKRVAIIGGGPAGMAAAFFLARQGAAVTLFEQRDSLGGIVRHVIPRFRISDEAIAHDESFLRVLGVEVKFGAPAPAVPALMEAGYQDVIIATGAWKHGPAPIEAGKCINVLDFLGAYKAGKPMKLGTDVVVIGGGNTAMDAARAAKRHAGVERCRVVYRRTRRYMPADEEELRLCLEEGVEFAELLAPVKLEKDMLVCKRCVLGEPDESGRRSPVETEELVNIPCTALIAAVGESPESAVFESCGAALDARGRVQVNAATLETSVPHVYAIGDARRGPATVVEGIADARLAADAIAGRYEYAIPAEARLFTTACYEKQGILKDYDSTGREAGRCLGCSTVCTLCAQVCPNRANVVIHVPGKAMPQILHIDKMCNECGNCLVFCPYDSAPYTEKITLFKTEAAFDASENKGFLPLGGNRVKLRLNGVRTVTLGLDVLDTDMERLIRTTLAGYSYLL